MQDNLVLVARDALYKISLHWPLRLSAHGIFTEEKRSGTSRAFGTVMMSNVKRLNPRAGVQGLGRAGGW